MAAFILMSLIILLGLVGGLLISLVLKDSNISNFILNLKSLSNLYS